jgi:hypothetical protein
VACPYFMPVERIENGAWPHPARLPLGAGWRGHCTAPGHASDLPPEHVLETFCNLGYASSCSWAPTDRVCDAVRFSVAAPVAKQDKQTSPDLPVRILRLRFVREKNHLPVDHGDLEFDLFQARWLRRHDDPRVQKMAECFLDSYLKKKA